MESWLLNPEMPDTPIGVGRVASLLSRVGSLSQEELAAWLLQFVSEQVALAQCAVFAYPEGQLPRIVSYADRARTRRLPDIALDYVRRLHQEDGCHQLMRGGRGSRPLGAAQQAIRVSAGDIVLHRQTPEDLREGDYRAICYDQPRISERIALLSCQDRSNWLAINFYRGREQGRFSADDVATLEALAPLVTQMVRLHLCCHRYDQELGATLIQRLHGRFPALTRRDLELLAGVVAAQDGDEIARQMGIQPSSVQTYFKRLYRKLGISGQRELFGLMLAPLDAGHGGGHAPLEVG